MAGLQSIQLESPWEHTVWPRHSGVSVRCEHGTPARAGAPRETVQNSFPCARSILRRLRGARRTVVGHSVVGAGSVEMPARHRIPRWRAEREGSSLGADPVVPMRLGRVGVRRQGGHLRASDAHPQVLRRADTSKPWRVVVVRT